MENKEFKRRFWWCVFFFITGVAGGMIFYLARVTYGVVFFSIITIGAVYSSWQNHNLFRVYETAARRMTGKSVEERLHYILSRPVVRRACLVYGASLEFWEYVRYWEDCSASNDFVEDVDEFLDEAKAMGKLAL